MKNCLTAFRILLLLLISSLSQAQDIRNDLIQFSGVTITGDSLNPVAYTKISIKNTNKGTTSDIFGFFSFVAHKEDTILFNAMGFKPASFVIPDTVTKYRYSLIQLMTIDTLTLSEAYIFPWPMYEDFKRAFVNLKAPNDDLERSRKNLEAINNQLRVDHYTMDSRMNHNNYIENQTGKLYYFG